jgi:DNA polymerase-3 subunit alpha
MIDFVHLHVHSDYSLLDGAASVQNLAEKARKLGMKHLAITDHGNMFGVMDFMNACLGDKDHPVTNPIRPIIGNEFYMAPGSRLEKKGSEYRNKYYHLVLLASSAEGYRNLMKLSSYAYTEGFYYKPRIDDELLIRYHMGLIGLSACIAGEIPSLLLEGKAVEAEARACWFRDLLGPDNFYLEIQDHGLAAEKNVNPLLIGISRRTGIPLAATNDIHYLEREDAAAQDIFLCISTNKKRSDERRLRFEGSEFYFKTGEEMAALFPDCPEAISNTVRIAERCTVNIPIVETRDLPRYLPDFQIPPGFTDANAYLTHLAAEGLAKRYPGLPAETRERMDYELDVIIKMGFTGYFLIVADFINWAKERGIAVGPGRGSGAGSIVAYALRITDIDPLKYKLLFERFLNPDRVSMPDFDVDFCNERRGEVIKYVTDKYGKDRVGQIITFGTLKARAVIKDVARALEISLDESNMIAKLIPEDPKMTLEKAFEQEPKLQELEKEPKYRELFELARKLEGKKRHASIHAAGVVIGKTDLTDYVPLYRDPKEGGVSTQFTMGFLEERGLVKMDFLGLKTLDLIGHTADIIRRRGGEFADFNIRDIDEQDKAVFALLGDGKSECIFQFESEGMQSILKQAKPASIDELTALTSLYRPGPMQYIPQYIESKWGRRAIEYPDPCLEDILKETYGVIVYQEQVMQVAQRIAGYTLGQADILRRAMGKKKAETIEKEKGPFIAGAVKQGFSEADADRIYEILAPFGGYGFNKSHAAAYSVLSYQTAWLKTHFPAEFMAANLTNEINNTDKLQKYIDEVRKMDIPIDPPDINRSDRYFTVVEGRIVYGFIGIKGLGDASAREIVECRRDGPYRDFMDFLERVNIKTVGKKVIELLIQTGAFDRFGRSRSCLAQNLERAVEYAQSKKDDKKYGQSSLFEDTGETEYPDFVFEDAPEWERSVLLQLERELIGFYFSGHPMDAYKGAWKKLVSLDLAHPERAVTGVDYTVVGIIKSLRPYQDKNGRWMGYVTLGDYNGDLDMIIFSSVWEKVRDLIAVDRILAFRGKFRADSRRDKMSFIVDEFLDIDSLRESSWHEVHIRLEEQAAVEEEALYPLLDYLTDNSGSCTVFIHVPYQEGETVIRAAPRISVTPEPSYLDALTQYSGVADVWRA